MGFPAPPEDPSPSNDVTRLLRAVSAGRPDAAEEVLPLIYGQLRAIAEHRMASERPGHTLQATALVHEVYLRILGNTSIAWSDRRHFFHVAAEAMRRLLIEHARQRGRLKRGGGRLRAPLNVLDLAIEQDEGQTLALDTAVRRLEIVDPKAAEIVRLRFFCGLSVEQTSETTGLSARTVKRNWAFARAWLHQALENEAG